MEPLAYQNNVCNYLQKHESALWEWIAGNEARNAVEMRLHLLKSSYQISVEAHPGLHEAAAKACLSLGIEPNVSLYQASHADGCNIAIWTEADEAHIVFQGAALELLDGDELLAVLGHELSHYVLWQLDNRRYWIANRVLDRLAAEERVRGEWTNTALRFQQHTEIFCDRGAWQVCGQLAPCVTSLVKMETGLRQVHADSYLKQAAEILAAAPADRSNLAHGHPQTYIRAEALRRCAEDSTQNVSALLDLPLSLDTLDVQDQVALCSLTRSLIAQLLAAEWFHSEAVLALARRYFDDFAAGEPPAAHDVGAQGQLLLPPGHQLDEFFAFVLLDFVHVDPALDDLPLAAAWVLADACGIAAAFERLLLKECRIKKTAFNRLKTDAAGLLERASASPLKPTPVQS